FTIIVNATDNLTATDQLKYKFTLAETQDGLGQAVARNGLSFTLEPSDASKTFWLNVQVCDLSGNVGNYVLPFTVNDVTAPVIESFTVTAQNSNAVLAWSASDNVAVVNASIVVDGVLFKSGNLNSPQTVTGLTSGNHTIALTVRDAAGNRTTTSVDNFSLGDVMAPQFANISLEQIGADYDFYLTVFATDDLTTPDKLRYQLEYRLEGETFLQAKGLTFQLTPAAASRTLEYQVTVTDESGNTTKSGIQSMIVRDTTAPQIPVNLQAVATDDGMYLNWNPAADNVATTGYLLLVGESQDQLLGGKPIILTSAEYALSVPHSGQFFWTVAAFDAAGNISAYSDVASFLVVDRDPYEPNDSSEEAYNLKNDEAFLNRNETWESQGAFLAPGDEDWFILKLQENGTDSDGIWLEYDASLGDLELSLTSKNGTKVFGSVKAVDGRAYLPLAGQKATGNFRIRIAAAEHQEPIPYTLRITASTGQIQPDRFDTKTHNDTIQTAVPLPLSEMSLTSLTIHDAYDVDFFHFTLDQNGGKNSAISATFVRSELMDMELYDGKGQLLSSTSTLQKAELSLEGLPVGDYYLKVHSLQDNVNSYSLKWNITQSQVPADRLEGLEPVTITDSVRLDDLTISPTSSDADRKDTFVITLPRQGDARSVISVHGYNPDWGNGLAYTITDEQGKVVASGVDSEIPLQGLAPGNYTLVVDTPLDGSYGDYVLEVKLPEETGYEVTSRQVLLIYACCDNNGHNQAIPELLNMQHVYANENVETYVLMDRSSDAEYQAMYKNNSENWSDTRVARLRYSSSTVLDQEWLSWGECDTGNLSTLQRFLDWAHTEVAGPAQYTLVLKDHGSGLGFCCQDEESGNILSIDGIANLLKNYDDIPVVVMDSCLMGSDLVVTTMSGVSDYLVASEAISYWYGAVLDFGEMYYNLTSDMTPGQIADLFVSTQYTTTYRDHGLTSFKTSDDSLAQALNRFGEAAAKFTDADWKALVSAFAQARDYVGGGTYGTSDFGLLLNSLTSPSPALAMAIAEFQEVYKNDVLSLCVSYPGTYGTGLAVLNPLKTQAYRLNYYTRGYKTTIPAWADFLQGIYDRGASASIDIASIKSLGIVPDLEDEALCLGLFCGEGLQISNIAFNGDQYFQLDISTLPDGKGNITVDALSTVGNQPGAVSLT
ncbi:MAG: hypothetical protein J6866_04585, partial [Victivallales bacterium]|nr:hypothetical protein [Victivallales bacterium]